MPLFGQPRTAERLALADGLAEMKGIGVDPGWTETNIVIFLVEDAHSLVAELARQGVEMSTLHPKVVRAVTHVDVDRTGIVQALAAVRVAMRG